jgi:hypothetical protein
MSDRVDDVCASYSAEGSHYEQAVTALPVVQRLRPIIPPGKAYPTDRQIVCWRSFLGGQTSPTSYAESDWTHQLQR